MKIQVCLDEDERGSAIEMANAIINLYMDRLGTSSTDHELNCTKHALTAISEHIQVFVDHYFIGE